MRFFIALFFLHTSLLSLTQPGFNKKYDLGEAAASFGAFALHGDTIIAYGGCLQPGKKAFGLLFAKMDTNGNVLSYRVYNDSLGDGFTQVYPQSFIKLNDGTGYVGVGQMFKRGHGYFVKYNNEGDVILYKEFPDSYSQADFYHQVVEVTGGFLVIGTKQKMDFLQEIFVLKTNALGNKLWEKKIASSSRQIDFNTLIRISNNEYVIGSGTFSSSSTPPAQVTITSKIFAIDSLGNTKWNWESPESNKEIGVAGLYQTDEGNWAYATTKCIYNTTYAEYQCKPKFIIRDANFKVLSELAFGVGDSPRNRFKHITQLSDGSWLCVGTRSVRYPIAPYVAWDSFNSTSGWMVKVSPQGDSLWGRIDTAYWNSEYGSYNELRSAIELPSGSIIACGETRTLDTLLGLKSWGWLLKVDKNGCLTMLDCATSGTAPVPSLVSGLNVFPNPARDAVTFTYVLPEGTSSTALRVFDVNGRAVFQKDGLPSAGVYVWETLSNPSGIYFYQLLVEEAIMESGKLIISK